MIKKTKKVFLTISIFLIISLTAFLYLYHKPYNCKNFGNPAASLFSFNKRVLCDFYYLSTIDPLFVGHGLDLESYEEELNKLLDRHDYLLSTSSLEYNVFPKNFLGEIPAVHVAYHRFMEHPNQKNAWQLLSSYSRAADHYINEASNLKAAINKGFLGHKQSNFNFIATSTDIKTINDDFDLIVENGHQIKKEVDYRKRILVGRQKHQFNYRAFLIKEYQSALPPKNILKKDLLSIVHEFNLIGPYRINTPCYSGDEREELFYFVDKNSLPANKPLITFKLATNNFYQKVEDFNEDLLEKDIYWRPIKEDSLYYCNDATFQSKLITLNSFLVKYSKDPLLKEELISDIRLEEKQKDILRKIGIFEGAFLSDKFQGWKDLDLLADYYKNAYQIMRGCGSEECFLLSGDLLFRYHLVKNSAPAIPLIYRQASESLDTLFLRTDSGLDKRAHGYFYAFRSAYSFTFFNFTPSVWRLPKVPKYITGANYATSHFISYKDLNKLYSDEEIKKFHSITIFDIIDNEKNN